MRVARTLVSLVISLTLPLPVPGFGQEVSATKPAAPQKDGSLTIKPLQGEGARNSIKTRSATQPAVEVRDIRGEPVSGAEVVFHLPAAGPGGVFHGWMRTQTARTNTEGQAFATGMTPNDEEGRFNIKVTATQGNQTASIVMAQVNVANGGEPGVSRSRRKLWIALGVLGAGAIAGGVAATRGGNSTPAAVAINPVVITPGVVTVGSPR